MRFTVDTTPSADPFLFETTIYILGDFKDYLFMFIFLPSGMIIDSFIQFLHGVPMKPNTDAIL
jgi:hypothetical protein